jgi:hypothetical protein
MEENPVQNASGTAQAMPGSSGCLQAGLLVFMVAWILLGSWASQVVTWALEQQLFMDTRGTPDLRWVINLLYGAAMMVPPAVVWAAWKKLPQLRFYQAFFLAGAFVILLVPARLAGITHAQITALLQIAGTLVFVLINRKQWKGRAGWSGVGLAVAIVGALGYPWLLLGALGSAWDTALNLAAALLFGAAASQVAALITRNEGVEARNGGILVEGLALALSLLVMATGLSANGNQGLLSLAVPGLGWALAALSTRARPEDGNPAQNWPVLALLAGLAAFWPMAFIDPDELQTIITLGAGELIQWANMAAAIGFAISLAASLLLVITAKRLPRGRSLVVSLLPGLVWVGALALYLGPGQPGLYGERLFVIMKDQADLSSLRQIQDAGQRRGAVYAALVEKADTTQAGIRHTLDGWRIPYQPYYLVNALEVQGGPLVHWWLQSRPEVDRVLDSPILRPLPEPLPHSQGAWEAPNGPEWNLRMIHADRVWNELGVTGKGIIVGQSDSGAEGSHPELADSYRGQGQGNDFNWFDPWYHSAAPTDIGGHGTHTLGTAVGNKVGVAPDAQWIGCVNLGRNLGNPALYLDCMQFMLAPFPQDGDPLHDGRPELGAHVLNNSWGCPPVEGCDANALLPAVSALRTAGIFVVASAGNDGDSGCGSVQDPIALYAPVYSVGAMTEGGNLVSFSSKGPVEVDGSGRTKPDIVAPGADVLSAYPGGTYDMASGTSMAGPHVVGVVALMWSANPDLIGDIDATQQILNETAIVYQGTLPDCVAPGRPNNGVGYGIVNAYEAVKRAMEK